MVRNLIRRSAMRAVLATASAVALLTGCNSSKSTSTATTTTVAGNSAAATGIVAASINVASTSDGGVGYRELGRGTPLVLIMGFGGTMDDWAPDFIDALAAEHRVVVFDNAGVGETATLPSPLTISAMADQTSALISSLHLGRVDVLGWSMGGMIAQALAVRHPAQVRSLVLAATQPGNGKSLPIPAAAAAEVLSSNLVIKLSVLFPAGQAPAARAYVASILQYPARYQASAAADTAEGTAIDEWIAGDDPAGPGIATLKVSTLVADGTLDRLNPVANDDTLASTLVGAQLAIYPDAGHAFLFQDEPSFVARVEQFLG